MIIPNIQIFAESFTQDGRLIGAMLSSMFLVQVFASPFWGRLSDRIGRRPVAVGCTLFAGLGNLTYGLAGGLEWLFLSRMLAGLGGANVAVASAYVSANTPEANRTGQMGKVSAAIALGLMTGPSIGGIVGESLGNLSVGVLAAAASGLSALLLAWAMKGEPTKREQKEDRPKPKSGAWDLLRTLPDLRNLVLVSVIAWFSLATLEGTFGRLLKNEMGLGEKEFGWIFGYESLIAFAIQAYLLQKISQRFSDRTLLSCSYLLQGLGLALFPLAPSLGFLFLASTLYAPGSAIANPTINALASRLTTDERQGELFGLLQSTRTAGFLIGPTLGGALFDWNPASPYFLAGGICLMASIYCLTFLRSPSPRTT